MARSRTTVNRGNQLAVRHGAQSPALVEAALPPAVVEVEALLLEQVPYLAAADRLLVERLARIVVRLRLVDEYIDKLGGSLVDSRGRPRGAWKLIASLEHQFRETAKLLGMGPAIRAQLISDVASGRKDEAARRAAEELHRRYGPDAVEEEK